MKTLLLKTFAIATRVAALFFILSTVQVRAEEAAGDWTGILGGQLHIVLHLTKSTGGHYSASLESPDQGAFVLQAENVEVSETHLGFSIPKISASFEATWDADKKSWTGTWKQGQSIPLTLWRLGTNSAGPKRPQEEAIAAAPRPYQNREVTFDNLSAKVKLAGTFSVPVGPGPYRTVVLISGSGAQTREEDISGHKIFVVLGDALASCGIAVLRYDKRGVGASSGDFAVSTSVDFASDVDAAVAFLKTRLEVDQTKIGLIGHSEGGAIAPSVAIRNPSIAFSVLMAAPAMRTDKLTVLQEALLAKAQGVPENVIAARTALGETLYSGLLAAKTSEEATATARQLVAQAVAGKVLPVNAAEATIRQVTSPWFRQALGYDPVPVLRKLKTPVLVLNGLLDLQVPAKENLALMREALMDNAGATIVELPNVNHMFQTAKTGSPAEYGQIEETFSVPALKTITDWVVAR